MRVEEKILTEAQIEAQNLHIEAQIEVQKSQNFRRRDWPRSSRLSCRSPHAAIPLLALWCVSGTSLQAPSLFLFPSGGPGLAGWILYRSASLVVDACCNKIPPSVRPLGFVAIYRLVHKWLLLLFVPNPNSVPSLFTPALELRAGPLEDPSQEL